MINRIWAFVEAAPSDADRSLFLKRVEWLNLTDVALFVIGLADCRFAVPASRIKRITDTARSLQQIGVATHLVTWIRPVKEYVAESARVLRPLCEATGARSLLFDAEEAWSTNALCGKSGVLPAATIVEQHWPFTNWPCELGASGIVYFPEAVRPLVNRCHYTLPQAYSIASKGNTVYVGKDGIERKLYRPGLLQQEAHRRWKDFRLPWLPYPRKPMVMGLAAWQLNRPGGSSKATAIRQALAATEALTDVPVTEVAYWSFRWILKDKEIAEAIREAGRRAKLGIAQATGGELEAGGLRDRTLLPQFDPYQQRASLYY